MPNPDEPYGRDRPALTDAARKYERLLMDYFNEGLHGPLSRTSARFLVSRAIELFALDVEADDTPAEEYNFRED